MGLSPWIYISIASLGALISVLAAYFGLRKSRRRGEG